MKECYDDVCHIDTEYIYPHSKEKIKSKKGLNKISPFFTFNRRI